MEGRIGDKMKETIQTTYIDFEQELQETMQYVGYSRDGVGHGRKSNLVNLKDSQPGKIQAKATKAEFTRWRKCVEVFVDSATNWKGGSLILQQFRVGQEEITHATTVSRQDAEASVTDGLRRAVTYQ